MMLHFASSLPPLYHPGRFVGLAALVSLFVLGPFSPPMIFAWPGDEASTRASADGAPQPLSKAELEASWNDLAGADAPRAYQGMWKLVSAGPDAAAFLDRQLKTPPTPALKQIDRLIQELNSDKYATRVQATAELEKMGLLAKPALEQAFAAPPSPEVHQRVKLLLGKLVWTALPPKEVQRWRAIETLEFIGTTEAQKVLERLAQAHPQLWQTIQAKQSLQRLQAPKAAIRLAEEIKEIATLDDHSNRVYGLTFSPDGKLLASAGGDGTARLWDTGTGKLLATLPHPGAVWAVAFTADSKILLSGCSDHVIRVWEVAGHKLLRSLTGHTGIVYGLAISPDGQFLSTGSADRTVRLWETATGQPLAVLEGHKATIWGVAFSPDGRSVVSASSDRSVKIWEMVTGQERATLSGHDSIVRTACFTLDGKKVICGDSVGYIKVWDVRSGEAVFTTRGHPGGSIRHLAAGPSGSMFATAGDDHHIKFWDTTGKELARLPAHADKARCLAFRPDGQVLATGGYDQIIKLWKLTAP